MALRHGHRREYKVTPEYRSWSSMISRCENPNATGFADYGGRGITVCARWRSGEDGKSGITCFVEDMGDRPPSTTIDRRDNNKDYDPSNCQWSTRITQNKNKRPMGETSLRKLRISLRSRSPLTEADAMYIRENPNNLTNRALAARLGVGKSTVQSIQSGKRWGPSL